MTPSSDLTNVIARVIVRKLIRLAIRRVMESLDCPECFGTGVRGGFVVPCSHGHEAVK
jgi:hypothetical protein